MSDLIRRQDAIEEVKALFEMGDCYCDKSSIVGMLNSLPVADEEKIATEYCMKHCLVMITIDSYEKLIAYYSRGTDYETIHM